MLNTIASIVPFQTSHISPVACVPKICVLVWPDYNTQRYVFKTINSSHFKTQLLIKGLRPVLEGFVVPMHEGACETGSQIPRA